MRNSTGNSNKLEKLAITLLDNPIKSLVGATAVFIGSCASLNQINYSEGARVGVVNKFSDKKGFFWKTYEGEMALEGLTSSGGNTGVNVWEFSLSPDANGAEDLARRVKEYMNSGEKVSVSYVQKWSSWKPKGNTDYYITDVQPMTKK